MKFSFKHLTAHLLISLVCLLAMTGSVLPNDVEQILSQGEIVVITRNSPTTYFEDNVGETGYEYELVKSFADYLGVNLVIKQADTLSELYNSLDQKTVALAAANLTVRADKSDSVRFSTPYMQVSQQIIYRRGGVRPRQVPDLVNGKLLVTTDSSHANQLRQMQNNVPELSWIESPDFATVELLQMVSTGEIDYTVVDLSLIHI